MPRAEAQGAAVAGRCVDRLSESLRPGRRSLTDRVQAPVTTDSDVDTPRLATRWDRTSESESGRLGRAESTRWVPAPTDVHFSFPRQRPPAGRNVHPSHDAPGRHIPRTEPELHVSCDPCKCCLVSTRCLLLLAVSHLAVSKTARHGISKGLFSLSSLKTEAPG